ncbi:hypothetical protein FHY06_004883 [Variovorax sp. BK613]|nr:hypothetical protein [Variovorax sp. BK613]
MRLLEGFQEFFSVSGHPIRCASIFAIALPRENR